MRLAAALLLGLPLLPLLTLRLALLLGLPLLSLLTLRLAEAAAVGDAARAAEMYMA